MLNAEVMQYMKAAPIWMLSSVGADNKPHTIPALFHTVLPDGTLAIARVFMNKTVENVAANPDVCVVAAKIAPPPPEGYRTEADVRPSGYRVEGKARYLTEGPVFEAMRAMVESKGMPFKGVVVVAPEKAVYVGPGPNNNKVME